MLLIIVLMDLLLIIVALFGETDKLGVLLDLASQRIDVGVPLQAIGIHILLLAVVLQLLQFAHMLGPVCATYKIVGAPWFQIGTQWSVLLQRLGVFKMVDMGRCLMHVLVAAGQVLGCDWIHMLLGGGLLSVTVVVAVEDGRLLFLLGVFVGHGLRCLLVDDEGLEAEGLTLL